MKAINAIAMAVGYFVAVLWLLGTLGVGEFTLRAGPVVDPTRPYTCHDGDGLMRRKYQCDFKEYSAREAAGINTP